MRIIGACINCGELDGIWSVGEGARCNFCRNRWDDCRDLVAEALGMGRRLLPIEIKAAADGVILEWPRMRHIPCVDVVDAALKAALTEYYPRLTTKFGAEGHVRGQVGDGLVDLRSCEKKLGLTSVPCAARAHPRETRWVLQTYKILLYFLFQRRLGRGDGALRPGAILWLPYNHPDNIIEVGRALSWMLEKAGGREFRERIMSGLDSTGLIQRWCHAAKPPSFGQTSRFG